LITKLYIIRHAEAEGNLWRRAHGWYNGDLTPNGMKQVAALERRMNGVKIDAIYSSPLTRVMKTAGAVSRACGVEITPDPRLREFAMGDWENRPWAELRRIAPEKIARFATEADWQAPASESMTDLYERTGEALFEILKKHEGGSVCIAAHAIAIRALCMHIYGGGLASVAEGFGGMAYVPNASLSLFEYDGEKFREVFFGDDSHNADVPTYSARRPAGYENLRPEMWFRAAESAGDIERAIDAWLESWCAVHGTEDGFSRASARRELFRIHQADRGSIRFAMLGEDEAGVIVMDMANRWERDCAHVNLLMLHEKFRGCGLGSQLVGEAADYAREAGRLFLRLRVAEKNARAIAMYRRNGFRITDFEAGTNGPNFVMKRWIGDAAEYREPVGNFSDSDFEVK